MIYSDFVAQVGRFLPKVARTYTVRELRLLSARLRTELYDADEFSFNPDLAQSCRNLLGATQSSLVPDYKALIPIGDIALRSALIFTLLNKKFEEVLADIRSGEIKPSDDIPEDLAKLYFQASDYLLGNTVTFSLVSDPDETSVPFFDMLHADVVSNEVEPYVDSLAARNYIVPRPFISAVLYAHAYLYRDTCSC